jgi:2-polyprenyl-3-methyl-5-hydroxy-6-metoxy-1,4-benzoquinol methylase
LSSGQGIRTEEVPACLLCQTQGKPLYEGLRDRLWGATGVWGFRQCPQCGLIWLNPRPIPEDVDKVYAHYQTHADDVARYELESWRGKTKLALYSAAPGYSGLADGWGWRWLGWVLSWVPLLKDIRELGIMCLSDVKKGELLDVGCGNGIFLFLMKKAGWDVQGVEPDPVAAKRVAEHFGVAVTEGTLPGVGLPDTWFDVVTLSHVIEHVHDPIGLLRECRRVLKPGGRMVIVTPNSESWGHQAFGDCWRDLDPPRHLYILSSETLRCCAEKSGIQVDLLRTSSRIARGVWVVSRIIKDRGVFADSLLNWRLRLGGLVFQMREEFARRTSEKAGEELVLIASRRS